MSYRTHIVTAAVCAAALIGAAVAVSGTAQAHDGGSHQSSPRDIPAEARSALAQVRRDLRAFEDPAAAVAAGYLPTDVCSELPDGSAGMGYHYVNPQLMQGAPDPSHPPILVYVPTADGGRTLGAAEWFAVDGDQDLGTDADRPSLLGIPFDGPMPGHEPGMPIHYDLHAWLFTANPDGIFAPFNPRVDC